MELEGVCSPPGFKEETPHCVRGDRSGVIPRALARGISAVYVFGWSWRRGLFPPPVINEDYAPLPTFPQSLKVVFGWSWRRTMPSSINGHAERSEKSPPFMFSGGVRGGDVQPPQLNWRLLAQAARSDTFLERGKPPSNFPQKET